MKKTLIVVFACALLGASWWLVSPLFLDKEVSEGLPPVEENQEPSENAKDEAENKESGTEPTEMASKMFAGKFKGADAKHQAAGKVITVEAEEGLFIRFEEFEVTNGPDLYVYLVKQDEETKEGIELGKLKGNKGSQNYLIPEGIDLEVYQKVVIWCKAFDEDFGYASLERQ
ncbi:DM13 domain-containing protein [Pseudalkalibacillus sp. SCS-8]|uniref:DM13 domain-containing protein n=1 Tax=Pseudalkalibacillus nanhaiensis TaxID=3115291 RepID=UPI0032DAF1B7